VNKKRKIKVKYGITAIKKTHFNGAINNIIYRLNE